MNNRHEAENKCYAATERPWAEGIEQAPDAPLPQRHGPSFEQLLHKLDRKTKPPGALGQLERLAIQICQQRQTDAPQQESASILVFAGSHGSAAETSAYPTEVTHQMVLNFLRGGAAISVMARTFNVGLQVVDTGVAPPLPQSLYDGQHLVDARLGSGTAPWHLGQPAMDLKQARTAFEQGHRLAQDHPDAILGVGEMGIGNTASASLLQHGLTGAPIAHCVGPGTGVAGAAFQRKLHWIAQASAAAGGPLSREDRYNRSAIWDWIARFGGFEILAMAGAFVGGARCGKLMVVDGYIATTSALIAERLVPGTAERLIFAHQSAEPGHRLLVQELQVQPLLDLGMRLGEGTGAVLAIPLIRAATAIMSEMASFDEAGVSDRSLPA